MVGRSSLRAPCLCLSTVIVLNCLLFELVYKTKSFCLGFSEPCHRGVEVVVCVVIPS